MELKGRGVLVSGASSGIGAACADVFGAAGARLWLCARRHERLSEIADSIRRRHGVPVSTEALDVRSRSQVESWVGSLGEAGVEIDVLVNNAGLARGLATVADGSVEDWEEMIDTNVKGLLYLTRAVLRGMVSRGRGHIVNIGSIAGHEVYANGNVYCATKHAVAALSRGLAIDTLGTGVRVSAVDPGMVETEFSVVRFHGDRERADSVYEGLTPLTPVDVAEAVLFCATRPPHANVREMILMPSDQATAVNVFRRE
jgi:serine 3-dehydrogenase